MRSLLPSFLVSPFSVVFGLYIISSRAGEVCVCLPALSGGPATSQYSQQTGMSQSVLWPAKSASLVHMVRHMETYMHNTRVEVPEESTENPVSTECQFIKEQNRSLCFSWLTGFNLQVLKTLNQIYKFVC